ncbi:hypothetical protein COLO4_07317 [Corchorus olitorius]|uniref:Uncharacterized protein n=1 Tax=Corchorus olitorius TaxID=93759 RepID=A0A1R3KK86_9ROSI|nr:hypothetical protein COLO4_07317 [Corchorus olitorius]
MPTSVVFLTLLPVGGNDSEVPFCRRLVVSSGEGRSVSSI